MATRKLTARFVETATTTDEREDIADAAVIGLQLRVTSHGAKSWALRYTRKSDGRRRRLTLGSCPGVSLDEARSKAREALVAIAKGADRAAEAAERRAAETFAEVAADWLERHALPNKAARVVKDDRSMLDLHVLPEIGPMKAPDIAKRDVIRLLDAVAAKPDARADTTRKLTHRPNRVFALVRSIFRWAVGRDLLKIDPTAGLAAPIKKERPRERDLSPNEIATLWKALERAPAASRTGKGLPKGARATGEGDIPMTRATALTLLLALTTAQRIGEVAGIAVAELDLNDTAPLWTIPGDRCKNGQANRVPLSPLAVRLIREARQLSGGSPWLFPNPKGTGPIDPHAPTKALDRARPAIGLMDFRIHDLRRTAATAWPKWASARTRFPSCSTM
jgi:integrase